MYSILDKDTNRIMFTGRHSSTKDEALKALAEYLFSTGDKETNEIDEEFFAQCNYDIVNDEDY